MQCDGMYAVMVMVPMGELEMVKGQLPDWPSSYARARAAAGDLKSGSGLGDLKW